MNSPMSVNDLLLKLTQLNHVLILNELEELGITTSQLFVMRMLRHGPRTIGQIAEGLHLSYSTVSGIIDRMERDGWVERVRDRQDRRVVWIQRTEKLDTTVVHKLENIFQQLWVDCGEEMEIPAITRALEVIVAKLEKRVNEKTKG